MNEIIATLELAEKCGVGGKQRDLICSAIKELVREYLEQMDDAGVPPQNCITTILEIINGVTNVN